jgi:membrane associated rhomboid family serine protease
MGIYDRGYMQDEDENRRRPLHDVSAIQVLIGINVLIWIAWLFAERGGPGSAFRDFMIENFMVSYEGVLGYGYVHTLITSAFSHIDLMHILFNMLALWFFGTDVENRYGYRNFIALYVICGMAGSALHVLSSMFGSYAQFGPALGASGAVMGIAVVAAFVNPHRIFLFMFVIPMPLWVLVSLYVLMDLVSAVQGSHGIANFAHLGGALAGFLMHRFDVRIFGDGYRSFNVWDRLRRLVRRKPKMRVLERKRVPDDLTPDAIQSARAASSSRAVEEKMLIDARTAERVDAILAKISREGIDALTPEERAFLEESSRKYRRD